MATWGAGRREKLKNDYSQTDASNELEKPGFSTAATAPLTAPSGVSSGLERSGLERSGLKLALAAGSLEAIALIFGGCCSNVYFLESIIQEAPQVGQLITFCQFLFVSLEGLLIGGFGTTKFPFVKIPPIPLIRLIVPVVLFFLISIVNNQVWKFDISVPAYIIFRSGGTITTMGIGYLVGKRYTSRQLFAIMVLSTGIVLASLSGKSGSSSSSSSNSITASADSKGSKYVGMFMLLCSAIMTSVQGLVNEDTYKKYGSSNWRQSLFYTHFLSLALFVPMHGAIREQLGIVLASAPVAIGWFTVPKLALFVGLNSITQYICVRGVNKLAGTSSALAVTIVLNMRKFVSLLLSTIVFGNHTNQQSMIAAGFVFTGAFLYSTSPKATGSVFKQL